MARLTSEVRAAGFIHLHVLNDGDAIKQPLGTDAVIDHKNTAWPTGALCSMVPWTQSLDRYKH